MENSPKPTQPFEERFDEYSRTNESLAAIVGGLDVRSGDIALAIGMDQGFALLEFADAVTVCEYDPYYFELLKERKNLLAQGKMREFLGLDVPDNPDDVFTARRNAYFRVPGRMARIQLKLDSMILEGPTDVVEFAVTHPDFSKLYLSNTLGGFAYSHKKETLEALQRVSAVLAPNSLLYITTHYPDWEDELPEGLHVDERLSRRARELEPTAHWEPRVYRASK